MQRNELWTRQILAISGAVTLAACGAEQAAPPPVPEVGVITVQPAPVRLTTELPGRTAPYMISEVRPQVSGLIQKRLFEEGASVQKGQLLYQIDPAPNQAAHDQAKAALARAEATLRAISTRAARMRDLVGIDAVSKQDADDASAAHGQAIADVAAARAALQTARINLGYTRVLAPISGRIGRSSFTPGALVTAGQAAPLAVIQSLDPIYVDVTQSSTEMLKLKQAFASGKLARGGDATARVELALQDGSKYPVHGQLKFSEVSVDPTSGSVVLRAEFPNPNGLLLPGMYVRATLIEAIDEQAIVVPQQGITRDQRGRAVAFVVGADHKIAQRFVETGKAIGNGWLVTAGLKSGDRLVIDGVQHAQPGTVVKPVPIKLRAATAKTE